MSELLPIRTFGDPILRETAVEVERFTPELADFLDRMVITMETAGGFGLAGNQVGLLSRVFVWRLEESVGRCVNPVVNAVSEDQDVSEEGCMSFPRLFRFAIERPLEIDVAYQDTGGRTHHVSPAGRLARTFLHEIDHLNGILFIDHLAAHDKARAERAIAAGELSAIPQPNGGPTPAYTDRLMLP